MANLVSTWNTIQKSKAIEDKIYPTADGMIISLLGQGLPQIKIPSFLPKGGYMIDRISKNIKKPEKRIKHTVVQIPSHALSLEDKQNIQEFEKTSEVEDGIPARIGGRSSISSKV